MIHCEKRSDFAIVKIDGNLDSGNAPEAEKAVLTMLGETGNKLIFDFAQLVYISSAGLRAVLLGAKTVRERNGKFAIAGAGAPIMRVFQLSGLRRHFNCVDTLAEAAEAIK